MTRRDEVIRMALEAGLLRDAKGVYPPALCEDMTALFERFAALVATAERDRCATECERRHANGNFAHDTREECADGIRALGDEQ